MLNKYGERTQPCRTPFLTGNHSDSVPTTWRRKQGTSKLDIGGHWNGSFKPKVAQKWTSTSDRGLPHEALGNAVSVECSIQLKLGYHLKRNVQNVNSYVRTFHLVKLCYLLKRLKSDHS